MEKGTLKAGGLALLMALAPGAAKAVNLVSNSNFTLNGGAVAGTKIRALHPAWRAAYAKASPALPPEAATTPAGPIWPRSAAHCTRLSAPRALNEPVC